MIPAFRETTKVRSERYQTMVIVMEMITEILNGESEGHRQPSFSRRFESRFGSKSNFIRYLCMLIEFDVFLPLFASGA